MLCNKLPIEVIHIIEEYIFGKCNSCNQLKHFNVLQSKIKIFKYKSIFDIDYDFPRFIHYFDKICNSCVKDYFYLDDFIICNYK